jgi:hypothetical protein
MTDFSDFTIDFIGKLRNHLKRSGEFNLELK